jgi:hypothetical protein
MIITGKKTMTDTPEKDASPPAVYLYVMLGASWFAFIQTFSLLSSWRTA